MGGGKGSCVLALEEEWTDVLMVGRLDGLAYIAIRAGRGLVSWNVRHDLTEFVLVKGRADAMSAGTGQRVGMRVGGKVGARAGAGAGAGAGAVLVGCGWLSVRMLEPRTGVVGAHEARRQS